MPADDIGSIWTPDPVHISQSLKHAGKELDREKEKREQKSETPKRKSDKVDLSSVVEQPDTPQPIIHENPHPESDEGPGANLDVTVG